MSLRCTACRCDVPPDAERCPRCLRKSTLAGGAGARRAPRPEAVLATYGAAAPPPRPSFALVRLVVWLATEAAAAPFVALAFSCERELEAAGLWLATLMGTGMAVLVPLRAAFSQPPDAVTDAPSAVRHYAALSFGVLAMSAVLFGCVACAALVSSEPLAVLALGMLFFLTLLLCAPIAWKAVRTHTPLGPTLRAVGRNAAVAIAIVGLGALVVVLRSATSKKPEPLRVPVMLDPALRDELDVSKVALQTRRVVGPYGLATEHLYADGGSFARSMTRLLSAWFELLERLRRDPGSCGEVKLWLPERYRTVENEAKRADEEQALGSLLQEKNERTPGGRPIHVAIAWGALPPG